MEIVATANCNVGCIVSGPRIAVVDVPSLVPICDLGIEPHSDVAVVRDRVVVVAPSGRLCVVDPAGPRLIDDRALEPATRLLAASDAYLLLAAPSGPSLVELDAAGVALMRTMPVRWPIGVAGTTPDPDRFVVARAGCIEEVSAASRAPIRRFQLSRSIMPHAVGATARSVWFVPDTNRAEVVVLPARQGGAAFALVLPEPIARVVPVGSGSLLIIGADTRGVWLVTLGERRVVPLGMRLDDVVPWRAGRCIAVRNGELALMQILGAPPREPERLAG